MSPCACRTRAATSGSLVPAGGPDAGAGVAAPGAAVGADGEEAVASTVGAGGGVSSPQAANAPECSAAQRGRKQSATRQVKRRVHAKSVAGANGLTVRLSSRFIGKYSNTAGASVGLKWIQSPWADALWKMSTPAPSPPSASRRMMAGLAKAVRPG